MHNPICKKQKCNDKKKLWIYERNDMKMIYRGNNNRNHKLQTKIKHLNGDIPIVKAVKKETKQEPPTVPLPPGILEKMEEFKQANITLKITET